MFLLDVLHKCPILLHLTTPTPLITTMSMSHLRSGLLRSTRIGVSAIASSSRLVYRAPALTRAYSEIPKEPQVKNDSHASSRAKDREAVGVSAFMLIMYDVI